MYDRKTLALRVIPLKRCCFCNRCENHHEVELLVASKVPGIFICQICIGTSLGTLISHRPKYWSKFRTLVRRLEPTRVAQVKAPR